MSWMARADSQNVRNAIEHAKVLTVVGHQYVEIGLRRKLLEINAILGSRTPKLVAETGDNALPLFCLGFEFSGGQEMDCLNLGKPIGLP